jgi:putative hydrolase of the HAD superfamily
MSSRNQLLQDSQSPSLPPSFRENATGVELEGIKPSNFSSHYHAAEAHGTSHVQNLFAPTNSLFLCAESISRKDFKRVWIVDADDTLWEENLHFSELIAEFCDIAIKAGAHSSVEDLKKLIDDFGKEALKTHGYGPVGFREALRDTWELLQSRGEISIHPPHDFFEKVVPYISNVPYQLRPEVHEFLDLIQGSPDDIAVLFTQGHLPIQARKVALSNLAHKFAGIALGEKKDTETYKELAVRLPFRSEEFIVIGNSLSHEVRPALELGFTAFHLDNPNAWHSGTHATLDATKYQRVKSLLEAFHRTR